MNKDEMRVYQREWALKNKKRLKEYHKKYYAENKNRINQQNKGKAVRLRSIWRQRVLDFYGGKCIECSFSNPLALEIDHVKRDKEGVYEKVSCSRNRYKIEHVSLYRKIVLGEFPKEDFQLLCCNCHQIKTLTKDTRCRHNESSGVLLPSRRNGVE